MLATTFHRGSLCRVAATLLLLVALVAVGRSRASAESGPAYFAVDRENSAVRELDDALQVIASFPTSAPLPAGIARDGERVYTLHPGSEEVIAYDYSGREQFRWSASSLADAGGMAMAGPYELGIRRPGTIEVRRPLNGTLVRTIGVDPDCGSHGLAWDGDEFWITCGETLRRIYTGPGFNPSPIDSPAAGCVDGGTALTASDLGELTVGCTSGAWIRFLAADGTVVASGNNFIDDYGLAARFEGTPVAFVAGAGFYDPGAMVLLDEELTSLASFPSAGGNAIAVDHGRIYGVDYNENNPVSVVTSYDFVGKTISSWETGRLVTGATMVGAELALTRKNQPIDFHDPQSGELLHSFPRPPSCIEAEGLSFDGVLLWLLCQDFLVGVDPQSGIELEAFANPATGCAFGGLALTNPSADRLLVGCREGDWHLVSTLDGSVVDSGTTSVPLYGIKAVRERQTGGCGGVDLLISQGWPDGGSEDFYGGFQWPEMTEALDDAVRRIDVAADLEDLQHMLLFDALWVDQRGRDVDGTASLSPTETQNLEAYLATGRRVVLVGGDDDWSSWNGQLLDLVGGAYGGEASFGAAVPVTFHPLVDGVTSLSVPSTGIAAGGIALLDPAFASLWRGSVLTLLGSVAAGAEYWPGGDNAVFFDNVARWIGCAASDLEFYDGFESGDTSRWATTVP